MSTCKLNGEFIRTYFTASSPPPPRSLDLDEDDGDSKRVDGSLAFPAMSGVLSFVIRVVAFPNERANV